MILLDIEIVNDVQVNSTCDQVLHTYLPQFSTNINSISDILSKVKAQWSSNGIDRESYVLELEKQVCNLQVMETVVNRLFTMVYNYSNNIKKISNMTVDTVIGGSYQGYNVSAGYDSAYDAVTNSNAETILTQYVNDDSTLDSFAVVGKDGSIIKTDSTEGTNLYDFASQNDVGLDQVAVVVGKGGEPQVWVSAQDLVN